MAKFNAAVASSALAIWSTMEASASWGSSPAAAVSRKNLLSAGPTRVRSTPAIVSWPMMASVSSREKLALAKMGPKVFI